jgi:hypothetical protein
MLSLAMFLKTLEGVKDLLAFTDKIVMLIMRGFFFLD